MKGDERGRAGMYGESSACTVARQKLKERKK
jgi:hypothetical protein